MSNAAAKTQWIKCHRCRQLNPVSDLDSEGICVDCRDVEAFLHNVEEGLEPIRRHHTFGGEYPYDGPCNLCHLPLRTWQHIWVVPESMISPTPRASSGDSHR